MPDSAGNLIVIYGKNSRMVVLTILKTALNTGILYSYALKKGGKKG